MQTVSAFVSFVHRYASGLLKHDMTSFHNWTFDHINTLEWKQVLSKQQAEHLQSTQNRITGLS
jgi:hypothetical protein